MQASLTSLAQMAMSNLTHGNNLLKGKSIKKVNGSLFRLVHAITPLEENKSFLEKVKLGEKLCGLQPTAAPWTQTTTHHNSQLPNSSTSCSATNDETSEDTDEELLPSVKTAIKWSNAGSKPKAKLMPSFTKKSLEFDSCPETEVIQIMRKRGTKLMGYFLIPGYEELARK